MRNYERWFLEALDDIGHGERLARAGDAQERLELGAGSEIRDELFDRFGLVAGGLILTFEAELHGPLFLLPQGSDTLGLL